MEVTVYDWRCDLRQSQIGLRSPIIYPLHSCLIHIFEEMAEAIIVDFVRACAVLRCSNNRIRHVWACGDHGVNNLADAISKSNAHFLGQFALIFLSGLPIDKKNNRINDCLLGRGVIYVGH